MAQNQLTPHNGPAPEPEQSRSIDLTKGHSGDHEPSAEDDGFVVPSGGQPNPFGPPREAEAPEEPQEESQQATFQTSPPPAEPEKAAEDQDYKHRYGETIQAIGDLKKQVEERDRQLQQMQLQMQAMMSASQTQQPQQPAEVPDDPDAQVTVRDMQNYTQQMLQQQQQGFAAQMTIANAGLTQQEVVDILNENPYLKSQNIGPVERAQLIVQAANLKRGSSSQPQPQSSSPQSEQEATPKQQEERQERPIPPEQRVVPQQTPPPARPAVQEPRSEDLQAQAMREYAEAAKIKDKDQRMAARKAAMAKAMKAAGIQDPSKTMAMTPWAQS